MKILDTELQDLDFMEVEVLEKFEDLQEDYNDKLNNPPEFNKTSEMIRYYCELVFDLFNGLFGEGTDKKIFGKSTNLMKCTKAVDELFSYIETSNKATEKEFNTINNHISRRSR